MSVTHLEARKRVVDALVAAGWRLGAWERLFEAGLDVTPEVQAEYASDRFEFKIELHVPDEYLLWQADARRDADTRIVLRLYFEGDPGRVVERLVQVQDTLSAEELGGFVRSLVPLCRDVLALTDAGLARVSMVSDAAGSQL
jgi:hypothetical protein